MAGVIFTMTAIGLAMCAELNVPTCEHQSLRRAWNGSAEPRVRFTMTCMEECPLLPDEECKRAATATLDNGAAVALMLCRKTNPTS